MTFKEKSLDDVPQRTPDVQIFFHGQLLLRSEDGTTCEVAVNPLAVNHVITIEARTKEAGKPDAIRMRHVGPLLPRQHAGSLIEGMSIIVHGTSSAPAAAWKCMELDTPIDYTSGGSEPPDEDFRWILNLEGPQFHERPLEVPLFNSHHTIKLQGGEYYFRTAQRADALTVHQRREGGKGPVTFRRIGVIASASVFLNQGESVELQWQSPDLEGDSSVSLFKENNTTHEIYVNNTPLFMRNPSAVIVEEHPEFDELPQYYKLISNVSASIPGERFQLIPTFLPRSRNTGSPAIPCQVERIDGDTND